MGGDRLATIDMGWNRGLCPFWGSWVPISHNVAWAEAYLHTKWYPDASSRLATIDMGRKLGSVPPFLWGGELGPHVTQSCLGLRPYQVASWSIQPYGHNRHGPKIWWRCAPLGEGELGPHLTQCGQGRGLPPCQVSSWSVNCLAIIHQCYRQDRQTTVG